jgi:Protein of unknown function (DUF2442)
MVLIKVIQAKYVTDYKIDVLFNDGTRAIIDLQNTFRGPVFEPLKNKDYFKEFHLDAWTICWSNGADYAPEFLYALAVSDKSELIEN